MGMALTGKVAPYKLNFGPFPGDVFHAPYPNAVHGVTTADSIKAIEMLFKADIDPKRVAAIIFEPVGRRRLQPGAGRVRARTAQDL